MVSIYYPSLTEYLEPLIIRYDTYSNFLTYMLESNGEETISRAERRDKLDRDSEIYICDLDDFIKRVSVILGDCK